MVVNCALCYKATRFYPLEARRSISANIQRKCQCSKLNGKLPARKVRERERNAIVKIYKLYRVTASTSECIKLCFYLLSRRGSIRHSAAHIFYRQLLVFLPENRRKIFKKGVRRIIKRAPKRVQTYRPA